MMQAKDDEIIITLLLLIGDLLNLSTCVELGSEQQLCLSQLVLSIISRRLKVEAVPFTACTYVVNVLQSVMTG